MHGKHLTLLAPLLALLLALSPLSAVAQQPRMVTDSATRDTFYISSYGDTINPRSLYRRFIRWRDRAQLKGYDSAYVAYPKEHPWLVKASATTSSLNQQYRLPALLYSEPCEARAAASSGFRLKPAIGLYFRGWGLDFGPSLVSKWTTLNLSLNNPMFSAELRLDALGSLHNRLGLVQDGKVLEDNVEQLISSTVPADLGDFVISKLNSRFTFVSVEARYSFNGRRFSLPAAWKQSIWQTKSAGGLIAEVQYDYSFNTFNSSILASYYLADTLTMNTHSILLGLGYGYNWVVGGGRVMLHASALPMFNCSLPARVQISPKDFSQTELDEKAIALLGQQYQSGRQLLVDACRKPSLSWAVMAKASVFWNISERWAAGAIATLTNYRFDNGAIRTNTLNWSATLYCGYRFNMHLAALWKRSHKR